ncbi:hypothetical protein HDU93_001516, partial [Gonapodya sp. JEL0774]
ALDEVPMVYCGLAMTYCCLTVHTPPHRPGSSSTSTSSSPLAHPVFLPATLTALAAVATYLVTAPVGKVAFAIFFSLMACFAVATFAAMGAFVKQDWARLHSASAADRSTRGRGVDEEERRGAEAAVTVVGQSVVGVVVAVGMWTVDTRWCEVVDGWGRWNPQLHAWWHVLAVS